RPGRGLVEEVDHRLAAERGHLADAPPGDAEERVRRVEERPDLGGREALDPEQVAVRVERARGHDATSPCADGSELGLTGSIIAQSSPSRSITSTLFSASRSMVRTT